MLTSAPPWCPQDIPSPPLYPHRADYIASKTRIGIKNVECTHLGERGANPVKAGSGLWAATHQELSGWQTDAHQLRSAVRLAGMVPGCCVLPAESTSPLVSCSEEQYSLWAGRVLTKGS